MTVKAFFNLGKVFLAQYNTANLAAIGEKVPGAKDLPGDVWYTSKQIGTLPVWWDQE